MQVLWKRSFDEALSGNIFSFQDFTVSDDGTVYMTAKIKKGGAGFFLLKITEDDVFIQEVKLGGNSRASSAGILIDEDKQTIQLIGVFGENNNQHLKPYITNQELPEKKRRVL